MRARYTAAKCPSETWRSGASRFTSAGSSSMRARGASGSVAGTADSNARVYGMLRVLEDLRGASHFDDPAQIHYGDAARNVTHQPQVVRNEQVGQLQLLLQIHQQVDHLRLDRDVERRHRLVRDDERRIERQRARQADALPLAAAELVRIAIEVRGIEADQLEQIGDAIAPLRFRCRSRESPAALRRSCSARIRGLSDEYGSWKTICMSRRAARIRALENPSTFSPRNSTSPDVGSISRSMQRPVVLLPLPDSPTSANVSPSSTEKLTLSTARTTDFARNSPPPRSKCLTRLRLRRASRRSRRHYMAALRAR